MSKLKNNHEALIKSGELKPEDTPKILKEDFLKNYVRKNRVIVECWNCGKKFVSMKENNYIFCCVECATEYFKQARGLI